MAPWRCWEKTHSHGEAQLLGAGWKILRDVKQDLSWEQLERCALLFLLGPAKKSGVEALHVARYTCHSGDESGNDAADAVVSRD